MVLPERNVCDPPIGPENRADRLLMIESGLKNGNPPECMVVRDLQGANLRDLGNSGRFSK